MLPIIFSESPSSTPNESAIDISYSGTVISSDSAGSRLSYPHEIDKERMIPEMAIEKTDFTILTHCLRHSGAS